MSKTIKTNHIKKMPGIFSEKALLAGIQGPVISTRPFMEHIESVQAIAAGVKVIIDLVQMAEVEAMAAEGGQEHEAHLNGYDRSVLLSMASAAAGLLDRDASSLVEWCEDRAQASGGQS